MVFFTCNACGQAIKKAMVEKHYHTKCPQCEVLSCMDCGKDFYGDDYKQHNQCITENEKYGGKGYQAPVGANKGEAKQEQWLQRIREACSAGSVSSKIRGLLEKVAEYPNVPRKRKKFENFVRNSLRIHNQQIMEEVWNAFSAASSPQDKSSQSGSEAGSKDSDSASSAPEKDGNVAHQESQSSEEDHYKMKKEKKKKKDKEKKDPEEVASDEVVTKKKKKVKKDDKVSEIDVEKTTDKVESKSKKEKKGNSKVKIQSDSNGIEKDCKKSGTPTKIKPREEKSSESNLGDTTSSRDVGSPKATKKKKKTEVKSESEGKGGKRDQKESAAGKTPRERKSSGDCTVGSSTVTMENNTIKTCKEENGVISSHVTTFSYDGSNIIITVEDHKEKKTGSQVGGDAPAISAKKDKKKKKRKHEATSPILNGVSKKEKGKSADEPSKKKSKKAHHVSNSIIKHDVSPGSCKEEKSEEETCSKDKTPKKRKLFSSNSCEIYGSSPEGETVKKKKRKQQAATSPGKLELSESGGEIQTGKKKKKTSESDHIASDQNSEDLYEKSKGKKKTKISFTDEGVNETDIKKAKKNKKAALSTETTLAELGEKGENDSSGDADILAKKKKKKKNKGGDAENNIVIRQVAKSDISTGANGIDSSGDGLSQRKKATKKKHKKKHKELDAVEGESRLLESSELEKPIESAEGKHKKKVKAKKVDSVTSAPVGIDVDRSQQKDPDTKTDLELQGKRHKKHKTKNSDVSAEEHIDEVPKTEDVGHKKKHKKHRDGDKVVSKSITDCSRLVHESDSNLGKEKVKKKKKKTKG